MAVVKCYVNKVILVSQSTGGWPWFRVHGHTFGPSLFQFHIHRSPAEQVSMVRMSTAMACKTCGKVLKERQLLSEKPYSTRTHSLN